MQIPILSGIYTDETANFLAAYPVNMVPVPSPTGVGGIPPRGGRSRTARAGRRDSPRRDQLERLVVPRLGD